MPENRLTSSGYYVMMPTWYENACRQSYLDSVARKNKEKKETSKLEKNLSYEETRSQLEKKKEEKKD